MHLMVTIVGGILAATALCASPEPDARSAFLPRDAVLAARMRLQGSHRAVRDRLVAAAEPWLRRSDEELWSLMFGNTIKRSWMVWSNGHCPSCGRDVPMYTWKMDALARPWKVQCPHCNELFPKNDFGAFYRSGLDAQGVFDPNRADRRLLFNVEHPDPDDPLHAFGVDDGEGYVDGDRRWRFIGAYLIYGQWKQAIVAGIRALADAYSATGDRSYAHKLGVLLDRVADLYPTHDFGKQGVMYEGPPSAGYVSTWHDACEETRQMAVAFDQVREALADDADLVTFLSAKAREHGLPNAKSSWPDIRRNIEDGLLRHPIAHPDRIHSNYPRTEVTLATLLIVLRWPQNRADVLAIVDPMIEKATAVDGVTGEKGLAGYSAFTIQGLAGFLAQVARMDPALLEDLVRRHPRIRDMFRFHVDTHCLGRYYPQTGDTGAFAAPSPRYVGAHFNTSPGMDASMFTLMAHLCRITGDPVFAQIAYRANDGKLDGLPYDLFCADPASLRQTIASAIRRHGADPEPVSVNKEQWRLAILRAGQGEARRAVWLDYDAGGAHGHFDALNLGLFAFGLDLLPELGYPPVQFGGWGSPRARWYTMAAAHNTVVVDGTHQRPASGDCTLWADGPTFRAVRARCAEATQASRFERTVAQCDVGSDASYIVDVFRVRGGREHVKFQHGHFGALALETGRLQPEPDYGNGTQMRAFRMAPIPDAGARAIWTVEDRLKLLPQDRTVSLNHWELTRTADIGTCEGWIAIGGYNATEELWIPRLVVRRRGEDLASTFVAVLEPHAGKPAVASARRLAIPSSAKGTAAETSDVAVEITLVNGQRDIIIARDPDGPRTPIALPERRIVMDGDMCRVTLDRSGRVVRLAAVGCSSVRAGDLRVTTATDDARTMLEVRIAGGRATVVKGKEIVREARLDARP